MSENKDIQVRTNHTFPKGNEFWKQALNAYGGLGPVPKYDNPDDLLADCAGYFADITDNPLLEEKVFNSTEIVTDEDGNKTTRPVTVHHSPKMRPMTVVGLCNYIGIGTNTWYGWRRDRADLKEAINLVEQIIWQQKFEGAAAGFLNHAIIARDLGLADTTQLTGPDGGAVVVEQLTDLSDSEIFRRLIFLMARQVHMKEESINGDSETKQLAQ